jgi:flagellar hook-associated protein 2
MSTTSSAIFTGTSRFTNDFQQVIDRSVAIASLPIKQLTAHGAALTDQASAVSSLNAKFASLQAALTNLGNSTGLSSLTTTLSDSSIARVTLGSGAAPASYSLEVISLGAFTNTLSSGSLTRVSDPATQNITNGTSFSVIVGGITTRITPATNTLNSLVTAINGAAGLNVQASLVNIGSTQSPDYRLSLQSTKLGPTTIQLNDGSADLLDTTSTGSLANYKVNGITTAVQSDSRTITLAPGVTAELLSQSAPGVAASVGIVRQSGGIGNALNALVNSFNAAADELSKHRGRGGGALVGNSLIAELGNKLRGIGTYSSASGQVSSLAALGITFDGKGHLSYDSTVFNSASSGSLAAVSAFLGTSAGRGFLKSTADVLASVEDGTTGTLTKAGTVLQQQIIAQQALVDQNQARVDQLRTNLQAQLARADARVAALEQSYLVLTGLFQAQQYNNQNR